MDLQWTIFVQRVGTDDPIAVGTVERPVKSATVADFGLLISEGRKLLANLQQIVAQSQIRAYDEHRRRCRHCGSYRHIKDWRPRTIATGLGEIKVRVPWVVSCVHSGAIG